MKKLLTLLSLYGASFYAQNIQGIQLFNPKTNDHTPIIGFNEQLVLRFDDLSNQSTIYRYTIKHYDRDWKEDGLFFTEYAKGNLNGLIDNFQYSFNTHQKYTHYELVFPNEKIRPIISGNFELIVYKDSADRPLFTKRFCVVEDGVSIAIETARHQNPTQNQRVYAQAIGNVMNNINSLSLSIMQNNHWASTRSGIKPSNTMGNKILFQQPNLAFAGNNEFYYFNNRVLDQAFDAVARTERVENQIHTYLHPVWVSPHSYQYQPDVNGAYYFRRTDIGIERNADREGDYSWVHFYLPSQPLDKNIYVLGGFNDFIPSEKNQMHYNEKIQMYEAKIYLKQGFYNYILATENQDGNLNLGEINGNFWQTENLYQGLLYYRPFGRNYDGILGYGELRRPVQ